ncbi:hypothetical protein AAK938_08245 [Aerococcaceae bacterium 50-4]
MGIENRKSTELEDLFASIVNLDSDGDDDKAQENLQEETVKDKKDKENNKQK